MRFFRIILTVAAVVLWGACPDTSGVELVLLGGMHMKGEARATVDTVTLKSGGTTWTIPRGSVTEARLEGAEVTEYESRKAKAPGTAEGLVDLARWLDSKLQYPEAEKHYEAAVALDPNCKAAREALGYKLVNDIWSRTDEDRWRVRANWFGSEGCEACLALAKMYKAENDDRRVEIFLRRALIADPENKDALALMRPYTDQYVSKNKYRLPFEGMCAVINSHAEHHRSASFIQYGLDFQKVGNDGRPARANAPKGLDDFYTWDCKILAAADGEVYAVTDGFDDLPLGVSGDFWNANMVCIRHAGNEYTVYGHLKKGSIPVKKGQKVKAGDVIGRGGNSGSSGWPHMHWAMYDRDGIALPATFVDVVEVTPEGEKKLDPGPIRERHVYKSATK